MRPSIKILYFWWLCNRVDINVKEKVPYDRCFDQICWILYSVEFYSLVDFDENRENDGKHLREVFVEETNQVEDRLDLEELEGPCSILEMLVALAERWEDIEYSAGVNNTSKWFEIMLKNLDIYKSEADFDEDFDGVLNDVSEKIDNFLSRTYEADGKGGLFPLKNPEKDQRLVEIWYQMHAYIGENFG